MKTAATQGPEFVRCWMSMASATAASSVPALEASVAAGNPARIAKIYSGPQLAGLFGDPTKNDRTPDIIVQPIPGTIYSTSNANVAEHGGLAVDDTHVALVVENPARGNKQDAPGLTIGAAVETTQIAPTILRTLGLSPGALDAVRSQHTSALPGVG